MRYIIFVFFYVKFAAQTPDGVDTQLSRFLVLHVKISDLFWETHIPKKVKKKLKLTKEKVMFLGKQIIWICP